MDTIKVNKGNVKMVAHRGVSGLELENTNAAFVVAGNRTYYGIETDVHVTKDEQIAVFHDDNLKRVAGVDKVVEESTLAELQSIPLFDGKVPGQFRTDLRIPILADYIGICKKYGKKAVLELKNQMEPKHITQIVNIIKEQEYLDGVIFISFSWENCVELRKQLPEQKIQFLISTFPDDLIQRLVDAKLDLDIHFKALTAENVKALHEAGIEVNCWTVDQPEEAEKLIGYGVDYITSNILE